MFGFKYLYYKYDQLVKIGQKNMMINFFVFGRNIPTDNIRLVNKFCMLLNITFICKKREK